MSDLRSPTGQFLPGHPGPRKTRHGHCANGRPSPTYASWESMWARCTSETHPVFHRYGGRGIVPCERWRSFEAFLADMGERPAGTTLDRIDNNKGYSPGNCRWATAAEQAANKRNNIRITIAGVTRIAAEWARERGLDRFTVFKRIQRGWDPVEAVTIGVRSRGHSERGAS